MKKIFLLTMICFACLAAKAYEPVNFGIVGGWTGASLTFDDNDETEVLSSYSGYHAGMFVRFNSEYFFFQPSLLFLNNNIKNLENTKTEEAIDLSYGSVEIPMMVGLKFWLARAYLGPVCNYITSDLSKLDFDDIDTDEKLSWKGQVGLGVDFWFATLDVNYQIPLEDAAENFLGSISKGYKANNFNVTLGIRFNRD